MSEHFHATVLLGGKTATGIPVPPDVIAGLGAGKRPAVCVTVGTHSYRTTIGVMGGASLIPLSAEHRAAAGLAAGDEVDVEIAVDTEPRVLELPVDLVAALAASPAVQQAFTALSYSGRRRHVIAVEGAKSSETRRRRIEKVVAELGG